MKLSPVEIEVRRNRLRRRRRFVLLVLVAAACVVWDFITPRPEVFKDPAEHFKYGSIGSESVSILGLCRDSAGTPYSDRGIPFLVWKELPRLFPEYLPEKRESNDYTAFGMSYEAGRDRPVGFSKREIFRTEFVGMNCAACHSSTWRGSLNEPAQLVLGMPAHRLDLQAYFQFLFRCADDERFRSDWLLPRVEAGKSLSWVQRAVFRLSVRRFREQARAQQAKLVYWRGIPRFGNGRIDTFGPYKALFFDIEPGTTPGTTDYPSLWNQSLRSKMQLHWDGNNRSLDERNLSAALGAGVSPVSVDHGALKRVVDWIGPLAPPPFPGPIDRGLSESGRRLYNQECAQCHSFDGERTGHVEPWSEVRTDPARLHSFTPDFAQRMNTLGSGTFWKFRHFTKTDGYANTPLDGLWLRAPYLHNGSVPTLAALLLPARERPVTFYRGDERYDFDQVGFQSESPSQAGRDLFLYDTRLSGNGNAGHDYGTSLSPADKSSLIEYLKTL